MATGTYTMLLDVIPILFLLFLISVFEVCYLNKRAQRALERSPETEDF